MRFNVLVPLVAVVVSVGSACSSTHERAAASAAAYTGSSATCDDNGCKGWVIWNRALEVRSTPHAFDADGLPMGDNIVGNVAPNEEVTVTNFSDGDALLRYRRDGRVRAKSTTDPEWLDDWLYITSPVEGYVYTAFIFMPQENERDPRGGGGPRTLYTNTGLGSAGGQRLVATIGDDVVFEAKVSTGNNELPTPEGCYVLHPGRRVIDERMTDTYTGQAVTYDIDHVLFTQYFRDSGEALHLNYWGYDFDPEQLGADGKDPIDFPVFGRVGSSHGCVGLRLHDAQYLWLFAHPDNKGSEPVVLVNTLGDAPHDRGAACLP